MEFQSPCVCWRLHAKPGCEQIPPLDSLTLCQGAGTGGSQPTPGVVLGCRGQWQTQVGSLSGLSPGWVPLGHPLPQLQPGPVSQWPSNSHYGCPRWPVQDWGLAELSHWGCPSLPLSTWAPSPGLPGGSGGAGWRWLCQLWHVAVSGQYVTTVLLSNGQEEHTALCHLKQVMEEYETSLHRHGSWQRWSQTHSPPQAWSSSIA